MSKFSETMAERVKRRRGGASIIPQAKSAQSFRHYSLRPKSVVSYREADETEFEWESALNKGKTQQNDNSAASRTEKLRNRGGIAKLRKKSAMTYSQVLRLVEKHERLRERRSAVHQGRDPISASESLSNQHAAKPDVESRESLPAVPDYGGTPVAQSDHSMQRKIGMAATTSRDTEVHRMAVVPDSESDAGSASDSIYGKSAFETRASWNAEGHVMSLR
jgi:hypothetical protein